MMDSVSWGDALHRLLRNVDPAVMGVRDIARDPPRTNNGCEAYSVPDADEPLNSVEVNVGWEELSSLCLKLKSQHSEVVETDGEMIETEESTYDMELERKQEELKQIEQRILFKKASIALKSVTFGFSSDEQSERCEGESLYDRVTLILQQRRSLGTLPGNWPPRKRMKSSRNGLLCEDHPLKLRVRALMKHRCSNLSVPSPNTEVLGTAPPAPAQAEIKDAGFQRFLSILNKGVDISYLRSIVNNDCGSLPSYSGEEKATIIRKDDPCPRSRSKSPPSVKKKRMEKEEDTPKESQNEQLQSILKTLGMSLEKEEMSKLADRTQERLFGKRPERREVEEGQQRGSDNYHRSSASRSDSSCGSHPAIASSSHQNPHTMDTRSECHGSEDAPRASEDAQMPRDLGRESASFQETSFGQYEYTQEPACSHPYPAAYSQYSNYTVPQHSQYAAYHGAAFNSYTSHTHGVSPASLPPSEYPHLPVGDHHFPGPALAPGMSWFCPQEPVFQENHLLVNSDWSESEGHVGSGGQGFQKAVNKHRSQLGKAERRKMADFIGDHQKSPKAVPTNGEWGSNQNVKKPKKVSSEQRTLMRLLENMEAEEAGWKGTAPWVTEQREKVKAFLAQKIESLTKKRQQNKQSANCQKSHSGSIKTSSVNVP